MVSEGTIFSLFFKGNLWGNSKEKVEIWGGGCVKKYNFNYFWKVETAGLQQGRCLFYTRYFEKASFLHIHLVSKASLPSKNMPCIINWAKYHWLLENLDYCVLGNPDWNLFPGTFKIAFQAIPACKKLESFSLNLTFENYGGEDKHLTTSIIHCDNWPCTFS